MHVMGWKTSFLFSAAAAAFVTLGPAHMRVAHACGGCFNHERPAPAPDVPPPPPSMVTAHRMAVSISQTQTVLWDSVSYDGEPQEFAWVLPVGPGARLELASEAFFEALDAVTRPRVFAPRMRCSSDLRNDTQGVDGSGDTGGGGCGGSSSGTASTSSGSSSSGGGTGMDTSPPESAVLVIHAEGVGPYEVVTLRSTRSGALVEWLGSHNYAFADSMVPVINAFEDEGADFLALRLAPTQGVRAMRPVRVVYPGAMLSLPLRMVQAGTGAKTGVVLYMLGEGRWSIANSSNVEVNPFNVTYFFGSNQSDYNTERNEVLQQNGGNVWLTSFARQGALLSPLLNPITGQQEMYVANSRTAGTDLTLAQLYISQAKANGDIVDDAGCKAALNALAGSHASVVQPCDANGTCRQLQPGEVDARQLACGTADDVATALVGMRPADVWVTRLEAELPRAALDTDLQFTAGSRWEVSRNLRAGQARNNPCPLAQAGSGDPRLPDWWPVALGAVVLRLRRRPALG